MVPLFLYRWVNISSWTLAVKNNIVLNGMKSKSPGNSRGRPRAFDAEKALDQAMRVFWKNGYEGASLEDLTCAMGINRPSLYAVFGNKEALFRKALDRYTEKAGVWFREAMAQPTAMLAVERLFRETVGNSVPGKIRGCLLVQGALACGEEADPIRRELARRRTLVESALRERFERAILQGDLATNTDVRGLAKYVATFQHGIAVQLAGGADRGELLAAIDIAVWAFRSATAA